MNDQVRSVLPIGHRVGGYTIVRVIGQGGFGIVYEAHNPVTRQRVAIKQFYPRDIVTRAEATMVVKSGEDRDLIKKILKKFEAEANFLANCAHPNILQVLNYIAEDNTGYMISEYVDGRDLRRFLAQYGGHFPNEDSFRQTMEPIVGAIGYVHRREHLHRDISPDNIMIDSFGKPILIDFGAAKFDLRESRIFSSIVQMKPEYAPPEQQEPSAERPVGPYTDVFALAGTMYSALAGKPPGRSMARLLAVSDPYVPIEVASQVKCPPEVYEAINSGLKLATRERPQTIEEYARMLRWQSDRGELRPEVKLEKKPEQVAGPDPRKPEQDEIGAPPRWRRGYVAVAALVLLVVGAIAGISMITGEQPGPGPQLQVPPTPPEIQRQPPPVTQPAPATLPRSASSSPPDLRVQQQAQDRARYNSARGNIELLKQYVAVCSSSACEFREAALREIADLERPLREAQAYQTALNCIRTSTSCNLNPCLTAYRAQSENGARLSDLNIEVDRVIHGPRCAKPTYARHENRDIEGGDFPGPLPSLRDVEEQACVSACQAKAGCIGYAYGKWDKACYLKQTLANTYSRKDPSLTSVLRSDLALPSLSTTLREEVRNTPRVFSGNPYRTFSANSRSSCADTCERESKCLGYTYRSRSCELFDRIDFATKDSSAQSGKKAQHPP